MGPHWCPDHVTPGTTLLKDGGFFVLSLSYYLFNIFFALSSTSPITIAFNLVSGFQFCVYASRSLIIAHVIHRAEVVDCTFV